MLVVFRVVSSHDSIAGAAQRWHFRVIGDVFLWPCGWVELDFFSIIDLGLYLSYIYVDMRLIMSYIRKYREITNDFRRFAGEFAIRQDGSFGVEKETDPRGLSLGGDRKDLGATAVVTAGCLHYRVTMRLVQLGPGSPIHS